MVAGTGRFRLCIPSPSTPLTTSLLVTSSLTLLTLPPSDTPSPPLPVLPHVYHTYTVRCLSLPDLFSLPASAIAVSLSPLASSNTLLLANSALRLSVSPDTCYALGLPAARHLRHPHQRPAHALRNPHFVPIEVQTSAPHGKEFERAKWALSADRVGKVDVAISAGKMRLQNVLPAGCQIDAREMTAQTEVSLVAKDEVPDVQALLDADAGAENGDVLEIADGVQRLMHEWGVDKGDSGKAVRVAMQRYGGICAPDMADDAVRVMRELARTGQARWTAVLARGFSDAPVVWKKGRARSGGASGFDADAAELFLFAGGREVAIQMRGAVDE